MTEAYLTPAGEGSSEYVEKKSRFLGRVFAVSSEDEARALLEAVKREHYDARHNCWCYILRGGAKRYSDDGEPQGTAGQPMLNVFEREGVENVLCVVTRYFGGILLGTGGLVRAYTAAAKDALLDAGVNEMRQWASLRVTCPYSLYDRVRLEAEKLGAVFENTDLWRGHHARAAAARGGGGAVRADAARAFGGAARPGKSWLRISRRFAKMTQLIQEKFMFFCYSEIHR